MKGVQAEGRAKAKAPALEAAVEAALSEGEVGGAQAGFYANSEVPWKSFQQE